MKNYWLERRGPDKVKVNIIINCAGHEKETLTYEIAAPKPTERFELCRWLVEPLAEISEVLWMESIGRAFSPPCNCNRTEITAEEIAEWRKKFFVSDFQPKKEPEKQMSFPAMVDWNLVASEREKKVYLPLF